MAITLSLENLTVESFETVGQAEYVEPASSAGPTLYGCTCGCGTYDMCPSDNPNCTTPCVVESGATDWMACCG
jgi:hypothetical protein